VKHTHLYVRAIYNCKITLREGLVKYEQLSIEGVRLDWLAHTLVCEIEFYSTTQELRMRIKYARKRLFFVMYRSPQVRTQGGRSLPLKNFRPHRKNVLDVF